MHVEVDSTVVQSANAEALEFRDSTRRS